MGAQSLLEDCDDDEGDEGSRLGQMEARQLLFAKRIKHAQTIMIASAKGRGKVG